MYSRAHSIDDLDAFNAAFDDSFASFGALAGFGGFSAPASADDVLNMTVGEYLSLLDLAVSAVQLISPAQISFILNNPIVADQLDPVSRAFLEDWARGDFTNITGPIDEVRDALAGFAPDTPLRDAINALDGNGGTVGEIEQTFADAEARLGTLLWEPDPNGNYVSPFFSVDPLTGIWSVQAPGDTGYGGTSLADFYDLLGEAFGNAFLAYVNAQQSLLTELQGQGVTAQDFATAQTAAEAVASSALEALQGFGAQITDAQQSPDFQAIEAQAKAQIDAVLNALTTTLPGVTDALNKLVIGSRNSDPSFVVSLDGNVDGSSEGDWFYLSKESDVFNGGLGKDILFGLEGDDTLNGGADEDALFGGDDDDRLNGGANDDAIDGGAGNDTAEYSGAMGRYTLQLADNGTIAVVDRAVDGDGTDALTDVETLSFTDGWSIFTNGQLNLSIVQGITGLTPDEIDVFIELYIAYFNRAPDALGLYFWGSAFANGTTLEEAAGLFLDQPDTRALYPDTATNLDFAKQVYSNVLGRAPDAGGLNFWVGQLDAGNVDRGQFILEVLKGAKADPAPDATQDFIDLQLGDRDFLANKTDIGTYYAVIKGLSDVVDATTAMALYQRGDDATIQAAVAQIDQDFADASAVDSGEMIMQLVGVAVDPFTV